MTKTLSKSETSSSGSAELSGWLLKSSPLVADADKADLSLVRKFRRYANQVVRSISQSADFKKRYFVLDGLELRYYKSDETNDKNYKGMIDLSTVVEVRYSDREGVPAFSFDLLTDARIFTLASTTASESDASEWFKRLTGKVEASKKRGMLARSLRNLRKAPEKVVASQSDKSEREKFGANALSLPLYLPHETCRLASNFVSFNDTNISLAGGGASVTSSLTQLKNVQNVLKNSVVAGDPLCQNTFATGFIASNALSAAGGLQPTFMVDDGTSTPQSGQQPRRFSSAFAVPDFSAALPVSVDPSRKDRPASVMKRTASIGLGTATGLSASSPTAFFGGAQYGVASGGSRRGAGKSARNLAKAAADDGSGSALQPGRSTISSAPLRPRSGIFMGSITSSPSAAHISKNKRRAIVKEISRWEELSGNVPRWCVSTVNEHRMRHLPMFAPVLGLGPGQAGYVPYDAFAASSAEKSGAGEGGKKGKKKKDKGKGKDKKGEKKAKKKAEKSAKKEGDEDDDDDDGDEGEDDDDDAEILQDMEEETAPSGGIVSISRTLRDMRNRVNAMRNTTSNATFQASSLSSASLIDPVSIISKAMTGALPSARGQEADLLLALSTKERNFLALLRSMYTEHKRLSWGNETILGTDADVPVQELLKNGLDHSSISSLNALVANAGGSLDPTGPERFSALSSFANRLGIAATKGSFQTPVDDTSAPLMFPINAPRAVEGLLMPSQAAVNRSTFKQMRDLRADRINALNLPPGSDAEKGKNTTSVTTFDQAASNPILNGINPTDVLSSAVQKSKIEKKSDLPISSNWTPGGLTLIVTDYGQDEINSSVGSAFLPGQDGLPISLISPVSGDEGDETGVADGSSVSISSQSTSAAFRSTMLSANSSSSSSSMRSAFPSLRTMALATATWQQRVLDPSSISTPIAEEASSTIIDSVKTTKAEKQSGTSGSLASRVAGMQTIGSTLSAPGSGASHALSLLPPSDNVYKGLKPAFNLWAVSTARQPPERHGSMYGMPAQTHALNHWEDPRKTLGMPLSFSPPPAVSAMLFGPKVPSTVIPSLSLDPYGAPDAHASSDDYEVALSFFKLHNAPKGSVLCRSQLPHAVPTTGDSAVRLFLGDPNSTYILLHGRLRFHTRFLKPVVEGAGKRGWKKLAKFVTALFRLNKRGFVKQAMIKSLSSAREERLKRTNALSGVELKGEGVGGVQAPVAAEPVVEDKKAIGRGSRRNLDSATPKSDSGGNSSPESSSQNIETGLGMALAVTTGTTSTPGSDGIWVETNAFASPLVVGAHATVNKVPHWSTITCAEPSILLELTPASFQRLSTTLPSSVSGLAALASLSEPHQLVSCIPSLVTALADFSQGPAGDPEVNYALICSIAALFRPVLLAIGEPLFSEGDFGECAYVVVSGKIGLTVPTDDVAGSPPILLATFTRGSCIGESALVSPGVRSAKATALTSSVLLRISAASLRAVLEPHPRVWKLVKAAVTVRERSQLARLPILATLAGGENSARLSALVDLFRAVVITNDKKPRLVLRNHTVEVNAANRGGLSENENANPLDVQHKTVPQISGNGMNALIVCVYGTVDVLSSTGAQSQQLSKGDWVGGASLYTTRHNEENAAIALPAIDASSTTGSDTPRVAVVLSVPQRQLDALAIAQSGAISRLEEWMKQGGGAEQLITKQQTETVQKAASRLSQRTVKSESKDKDDSEGSSPVAGEGGGKSKKVKKQFSSRLGTATTPAATPAATPVATAEAVAETTPTAKE